eukprot:SAG11_NODE_7118_length_1190_cov_1.327223_2_plen_147_part_00
MNDIWRSANAAGGVLSDCSAINDPGSQATGVGGGNWYRFVGAGGDAVPLAPVGSEHCGSSGTGWLSGWVTNGGGAGPLQCYSTMGRYPTAVEGVVEMTACFEYSRHPCDGHAAVGVVRCGDFLLWRLSYSTNCLIGYCTVPSELHG